MKNNFFKNVFNREKYIFDINFNKFQNQKVLITGSKGSIGSRIHRKLLKYTKKVWVMDIKDDITKVKNFSKIKKIKFDFIFHLAADKRATTGEEYPAEVSIQNILSTKNVSKLKFKKLIFASTCKAADPITSYGASKLICERIILNAGGSVVRFVNVFDTSHSVTKIWKNRKNKKYVEVTKCKRYFISLQEALDLLLYSSQMSPGRYSMNRLKLYKMDYVAKKMYPSKKLKFIPLRFGDRLQEKLVGKTEKIIKINKNIIQIRDCWGK